MNVYLGSAVLNGPAGAADTPERFLPVPYNGYGCPTVMALIIHAETPEEAREKQVQWHLLRRRIHELESEERPVAAYDSAKYASIALLAHLADRALCQTLAPAGAAWQSP